LSPIVITQFGNDESDVRCPHFFDPRLDVIDVAAGFCVSAFQASRAYVTMRPPGKVVNAESYVWLTAATTYPWLARSSSAAVYSAVGFPSP
jgi:hypothetical protein